jgi:hypothetical protein
VTPAGLRAAIAEIPETDVSSLAPLDSPAFTGTPTVPTAATSTNDTQIATTAFVKAALSGISAAPTTAFVGASVYTSGSGTNINYIMRFTRASGATSDVSYYSNCNCQCNY